MPNSQGIYCFIFDTFSLIFSNPIFIFMFLESSPKFSNQQNHAKTFFFNLYKKENFCFWFKYCLLKETNQYFDMIKHYKKNPINFPKIIEKKNCSLFI